MKVNLHIFLYILAILTIGCDADTNLKGFELDSINATIELPRSYKVVNEIEIKTIINKVEDTLFRNELLSFIMLNSEDILLVDTLNPYKFILISDIKPRIEIDSTSFYYIIDKERQKSCTEPKVDSTYYIGSKIGNYNGIKFIESKYLRYDNNKRQRFGYVFVITSEQTSIGISFFSPEDQETEKYIESINRK